ncbi:hypothetical protein SERLA73DRAFT_72261 [Serpula lacrymans var. lacrymans S7.3]|uniref:histone deacetylase n=1 Tax=Serpula lacrymans var. lacrymans (strain S7.3) TaxID=936435 RepID=F8PSI6_SERL3|nr:hypothetical protein SERLA73DRAFT_72261 [Serpula lacrymans var. lacrymans S7.3]
MASLQEVYSTLYRNQPSKKDVMDVDDTPTNDPAPARPPSPGPGRASSEPLRILELTVGYVYSSEMLEHWCLRGHEEQPERIIRIWKLISEAHLDQKMKRIPIRAAKREEVLLVHSEDLWHRIQAIQSLTLQDIQDSEAYYDLLSLYVNTGTTRSALLSCGGVIEACLAVARNELKKAFAIVRPPGHHAEPDEHMGFCFFNNVAVAARVVQLLTPVKRIMILDWDVHHGNGTQRAFNDDPSILYVSLHRYQNGQFYPGGTFGGISSCGEGAGRGYSVNIPWPEIGMGDADYLHAFTSIVMPIAMEFAPELVIISAGFDAVEGDPLGECRVTPIGYAHMTHMLSGLAGGKLIVALEGGYCVDATANSALAVTRVMLGEPPEELPPMTATEAATETVWQVALEQSKYWKSVKPKACEPREELEPLSFSIPEILKAHRQHYLYTTYDMLQIPLMTEAFEKALGTQVLCTSDLPFNKTLVIFIHEFGNLRIELDSTVTCNVNLERSYLIDSAKELVAWIRQAGYSLLDLNIFPKPYAFDAKGSRWSKDDLGRNILVYLWDNYIQLSDAQNVIVIGHGPGCQPLIALLSERFAGVKKSVKAVVQVVSNDYHAAVPKDLDIRKWYQQHSQVVVPSNHRILTPEMSKKNHRWHGVVSTIDEPSSSKLMIQAFPKIQNFVEEKLEHP